MTFPVYFWLGSLRIHPHFLFEAIAYLTGLILVLYNANQAKISSSQLAIVSVTGLIGAFIGAKVLSWWQYLPLLLPNPQAMILLLFSGKTIVGAVIGAAICIELVHKTFYPQDNISDILVYPAIISTAIGRIGCFLTGLSDRTYGIITNLPWGIDFGDGVSRHPTQIYEIIFLLILLIFLHNHRHYQYKSGDLFKFYLVSYLSFRFLVEFVKPDYPIFLGLSAIQIACLITLVYLRHSIFSILSMKT
ncbi:prolipoprotein diacylglyceryl transferase [Calothrix sp. 336/3]|uniref:prolipoprotein diacylglyceryl transferase n=1 Tax=Calothrix sp. 336/3 TaxID=1337936 RepID=UPI0004E41274|nr:prolipoprotein diacylglyceryl transferase family protein [Calothrix sp. 336/3]AKG21550.1 diacylglyceryl transferase [Calothrix sp. 336/3]